MIAEILSFLEKYLFVSIEWKDGELTGIRKSGEGFGATEFLRDSPTRHAFLQLSDRLEGLPDFKFEKI